MGPIVKLGDRPSGVAGFIFDYNGLGITMYLDDGHSAARQVLRGFDEVANSLDVVPNDHKEATIVRLPNGEPLRYRNWGGQSC